ncbi:Isoflavone reductase, partial [Globisporangium splendens]
MRVAILGAGHIAKYLAEELPSVGHEVVVVTRSHKNYFDGKPGVAAQRLTDYSSVPQLVEHFKDCDAVISGVADYSPAFTANHLNVLAAIEQVPSIKRFIVSEYAGDAELGKEYSNPFNIPVIDALKTQNRVEWAVIGCGLFADYLFPSKNRYLSDHGPYRLIDWNAKAMPITGDGNCSFSAVSIRDAARAIAHLIASKNKWRNFISIQAVQTTWNEVANIAKARVPDLEVTHEDSAPLYKYLAEAANATEFTDELITAKFKAYTLTGAARLNPEKAVQDKADYFPELHLRSIDELFIAYAKNPDVIL